MYLQILKKEFTSHFTQPIVSTYKLVTIYYVNNIKYINQQLIKVKILATRFSYNEPSSGQKQNVVITIIIN